MSNENELFVFDGDYGLVSLDTDCIQSILYIKVAKVPVEIRLISGFKSCLFYTAPTFANKSTFVSGNTDIVKHLRTLQYNIDYGLTPKQCSETFALSNLIKEKLRPAIEFFQWVDQRNIDEFMAPWFMRALPFPYNYVYVRNRKEKAANFIESVYPFEENIDVIKEYIVKNASQCLSSLSTRLGTSAYFYGDTLTSLDVMVYAYIAPMIKLPLVSKEISSLITSLWPNLEIFVKRIEAKYFPDVSYRIKYLTHKEKTKHNEDEVSYTAIFLYSFSAITLLVTFAMNKGLLKFQS